MKLLYIPLRAVIAAYSDDYTEGDDLYDALKAGTIAGAALDVFPTEPPKNMRFQDEPNCLVTPHLGASTIEVAGG